MRLALMMLLVLIACGMTCAFGAIRIGGAAGAVVNVGSGGSEYASGIKSTTNIKYKVTYVGLKTNNIPMS